ncbi:hypothetical protein AB0J90_12685 [Micromonospora sp. NPDC049523]|uniref:hypothetical protein n=1 Tax=Micromonospora sp. NPDC049523 TaxID=3155921 RepID=UPI00343993D0
MTNVQQPEMRRNENNPTVQDSKGPRPGDRRQSSGGAARPVPPEQVSPYGPSSRPVARTGEHESKSE